jgi:hypothetical protein
VARRIVRSYEPALDPGYNDRDYNFVTIVELGLVGANLFMLVNYEPYLFDCMIYVFYYMKKHVVLKDPWGKL